MKIKSLKLIDGDTFVVGVMYGNSKVANIFPLVSKYVVEMEDKTAYEIPITSVLFARLTEETK